jgi:predicted  nucleic acid-binding Zn-ribbon protein
MEKTTLIHAEHVVIITQKAVSFSITSQSTISNDKTAIMAGFKSFIEAVLTFSSTVQSQHRLLETSTNSQSGSTSSKELSVRAITERNSLQATSQRLADASRLATRNIMSLRRTLMELGTEITDLQLQIKDTRTQVIAKEQQLQVQASETQGKVDQCSTEVLDANKKAQALATKQKDKHDARVGLRYVSSLIFLYVREQLAIRG